jgi:hypothetical protein
VNNCICSLTKRAVLSKVFLYQTLVDVDIMELWLMNQAIDCPNGLKTSRLFWSCEGLS